MWFKLSIIIILFLTLSLIQYSFLPHFNISGIVPNLIFILFFILVFFERLKNLFSVILLISGAGIIFDIFYSYYLGISIVLLYLIYLFIKAVTYFTKEDQDINTLVFFTVLFVISFLIYRVMLSFIQNLPNFSLNINLNLIITETIYNLIFAVLGYYIYKLTLRKGADFQQLSLFKQNK